MYLLLGPTTTLAAGTGAALRERTAPQLLAAGAHSVQVNVVDPALGHPFGVTPEAGIDQILASLAVWVDRADGARVDSVLPDGGPAGAAWHGWLVCEAEPRPNRLHPPGPDGRVPGFAQLVGLSRPAHLAWSEWRRIWQESHTPVALHTQSTFRYVQNVVFRPITTGAPGFAAVVEECFPLEASTDLQVFFDSVGDEARLARHMAAMSESCDRFMAGVAPVSWTSEWLYGDG